MTSKLRLALTLAFAFAGCGQATTPGGDAGVTSPDTGLDAGSVTPNDTGASSDAFAPSDASPGLDTGVTTGASASVTDLFVGGNCKPLVPPDPITASWTVHVAGATGSSATVTSATLTLVTASGTSFVQTLTLDAAAVSLSGGSGMRVQIKTMGTPDPPDACGTLCGAQATLDLVLQIDGSSVPASANTTMGCAL